VRGALGWEPRLSVSGIASSTGASPGDVDRALAALALSGMVGFDLAEGGFFRRELPFDVNRSERLQPRLRDARRLIEASAVRVESAEASGVTAWVAGGGGVEYLVRATTDGWACTCPWYGKHRGDRGPCKHVLAVQIAAADAAG
jgi:predicted nucleic acid-binding Zn finger protein